VGQAEPLDSCGKLPHPGRLVAAPGGEERAVGAEATDHTKYRGSGGAARLLWQAPIPGPSCRRSGGEQGAVGAEGTDHTVPPRAGGSARLPSRAPTPSLPLLPPPTRTRWASCPGRVVVAPGGEEGAVGAEGDGPHEVLVVQAEPIDSRGKLPHPGCFTPGGEEGAIRPKATDNGPPPCGPGGADRLPWRAPRLGLSRPTPGGEKGAVRAEGHGPHFPPVGQADRFESCGELHTRTVSPLPAARRLPSGLKATDSTGSS